MYKFDIRIDPATGLQTVYMLPDDVILNTRRAFSVSTTTANGYCASLGAPEGRYIAPANSADCIQLKAGDCAPRDAAHPRAVVHALRHRRHQAVPAHGPHELRAPGRRAERVRQHQLQPGRPTRAPARRSSRSTSAYTDREQHLRSGRPPRAADVPDQLVRTDVRDATKGRG